MRLIDADALAKKAYEVAYPVIHGWNDHERGLTLAGIAQLLDEAPTIDVVRCRECRYSREPNRAFRDENVACDGVLVCYAGFDHVHPTSDDGMIFVDADGFCDQGQRREDGEA